MCIQVCRAKGRDGVCGTVGVGGMLTLAMCGRSMCSRWWGTPWGPGLSPAPGRAGLRLGHAEAPVLLWRQQQAPGACGPYPEHLVPAAGAGPPEPV